MAVRFPSRVFPALLFSFCFILPGYSEDVSSALPQPASAPVISAASPEAAEQPGLLPRLSWAVTETFASNLAVWSWNYFVIQAPFSHVSPEIWATHFESVPGWDNSDFFTNQILHPYQGSMYFNSARTNGFNFWESAPFSLMGSAMWEYFGERDYPSMNDLITTTMGGIALGEATYRMSAALVTDKPSGYRGVARELVAAALNPVQAVNRLAFDRPVFDPGMGRPPEWSLDLISGVAFNGKPSDSSLERAPYPFFGGVLDYGDPYSSEDWRLPYDYFTVNCGVTLKADNSVADVFAHAVLVGRDVHFRNHIEGAFGLFQHFDYLESTVYKFAANGVGLGIQAMAPFGEKGRLQFWFHLSGIALGGVDSAYSRQVENRDYCLGPGTSFKSSLILNGDGPWRLSLIYNRYQFWTISGADNHNQVGIFAASAEFDLSDHMALGGGWTIYDRQSDAAIDNAYATGGRIYLKHAL